MGKSKHVGNKYKRKDMVEDDLDHIFKKNNKKNFKTDETYNIQSFSYTLSVRRI